MSKLRVGVIYGGPSAEHDISLLSGKTMLDNINRTKYDVKPILIDRDGKWQIDGDQYPMHDAEDVLKEVIDFALIGLHGTFGEDGTIQALLEKNNIAYSGTRSHASKLAMNKHETALLFKDAGFHVPNEEVLVDGYRVKADHLLDKFVLPVIVKPRSQGSSVGIAKVDKPQDLSGAIDAALKQDTHVLIQEYIQGKEVPCGVIENEQGELKALPPTELTPLKSDFFDYDAKYTPGFTREITPPDMEAYMIDKIKACAISAHRVIGCSGYSRTDMIVRGEDIFMIEINTLPGMTATSILPQQARAANMSMEQLLDLIIQAGLHASGYNSRHE